MRLLTAVIATLAYLALDFFLTELRGPFGVFLIHASLAAAISALITYLLPKFAWIPIAAVGIMTLILPLIVLVVLSMPVYHTIGGVLTSLMDAYSTEWNYRGASTIADEFGPLATSLIVVYVTRRWRFANT